MQENTKQVAVKMTARRCFRTEPIYQYDVGHVLTFEGFELPMSFEVHFSRSPMGNAIPQIGTDGTCTVPDMYTQSAGVIYAWLYIADTDTGLTKYSIEIPVAKRAKPTNQEPTPVEQSAIDQAIAALNAGAEAAEDAQEAAEAAQASAESYAESAGQSAITATNAANSATSAKTAAETAARNAAASATDAHTSREAADQSATNAGISERAAASSASAAAGSATSAAASEGQASASATAASGSASTASTKASEAAQSATAAAGSAASASEAAGTASTAATAAENSATAAAGSATAAAGSATSAGQSATAAAGSAQAAQDVLDSIPADYSELSDDVNSIKSAITELEPKVDSLEINKADIIVSSASGAIASFSDGADGMPVKELTVAIEPVQNLNGQDAPYPPGGGRNKLQNTATSKTENGITFTVNADGSVKVVGTATAATYLRLSENPVLPNGEYKLSGCTGGASGTYDLYIAYKRNGSTLYVSSTNGVSGQTLIVDENTTEIYFVAIRVYNGATVNTTYYPMLLSTSETDFATWTPYSNVCPISGWDGVKVTRTGVNLWDEEWELGDINIANGEKVNGNLLITKNYIPICENTTYYWHSQYGGIRFFYDSEKNYIKYVYATANTTFVSPVNAKYMKFREPSNYGTTYNHDISINYPSSDTAYHPGHVQTYSITLPSEAGTVYGGELNVNEDGTGQVVVDMATLTLNGTQAQNNGKFDGTYNAVARWALATPAKAFSTQYPDAISDKLKVTGGSLVRSFAVWVEGAEYGSAFTISPDGTLVGVAIPKSIGVSSAAELNTWLSNNPVTVCYKIATPQTYTLTASQVTTLLGTNNVWADAGDVSVRYRADTKLYIDNKITQAIAAALNA